jgi:hypothetical protein
VVSDGRPCATTPHKSRDGHPSGTAPGAPLAVGGADPTPRPRSQIPEPGANRFPPDSVFSDPGFDQVAADAEQRAASPGIPERFEPDNPGMHTTDTIDYGIVLDGEVWLELDDGQRTRLRSGDTVVQNGTRHAWRNLSEAPATVTFVQIGARRLSDQPPAPQPTPGAGPR